MSCDEKGRLAESDGGGVTLFNFVLTMLRAERELEGSYKFKREI